MFYNPLALWYLSTASLIPPVDSKGEVMQGEGKLMEADAHGRRHYTLERDTIFNTDTFEKGDLVVKINYYKFERHADGGFRVYSILDKKGQERMVHVSSLIRISGLLFSNGPGGPAERVSRSAEKEGKRYYLSREAHHAILSCCYE